MHNSLHKAHCTYPELQYGYVLLNTTSVETISKLKKKIGIDSTYPLHILAENQGSLQSVVCSPHSCRAERATAVAAWHSQGGLDYKGPNLEKDRIQKLNPRFSPNCTLQTVDWIPMS